MLLLLLTLSPRFARAQQPMGQVSAADQPGEMVNQASFSYTGPDGHLMQGQLTSRAMLVDPRGQVRGCNGLLLPDYTGFQIGLYDPAGANGDELGALVALTPTGSGGSLPPGVEPNTGNVNPFPLANSTQGKFGFLFDRARGQLAPGRSYLLVLSPPAGSGYRQRRVRISIGAMQNGLLSYTATSLDAEPVSAADGRMTTSRTVVVADAARDGLVLAPLNVGLSDCPMRPVEIVKTGDRASAQPGDTVVYRVAVRNGGSLPLSQLVVTDTLPTGFDFQAKSVRATLNGQAVALQTARTGRTVTFSLPAAQTLPGGQTWSIAYAALLSPSALRGSGQNSARVSAQTTMTMGSGQTMTQAVADGPVVYGVQVRDGLLSDTGTIIGRVFVDTSRDGEQQRGEPGIPGAVLFLDDSTRIVSDANGLFSVPSVPAGMHVATLDFRSVPGYVLAPNHRFVERRSVSRLVDLAPGGLVRLNFGLLPRSTAKTAP